MLPRTRRARWRVAIGAALGFAPYFNHFGLIQDRKERRGRRSRLGAGEQILYIDIERTHRRVAPGDNGEQIR